MEHFREQNLSGAIYCVHFLHGTIYWEGALFFRIILGANCIALFTCGVQSISHYCCWILCVSHFGGHCGYCTAGTLAAQHYHSISRMKVEQQKQRVKDVCVVTRCGWKNLHGGLGWRRNGKAIDSGQRRLHLLSLDLPAVYSACDLSD